MTGGSTTAHKSCVMRGGGGGVDSAKIAAVKANTHGNTVRATGAGMIDVFGSAKAV